MRFLVCGEIAPAASGREQDAILMIRLLEKRDFELIYAIINDGALAYRGVIPEDCWTEPYMSRDELEHEMDAGVGFWGYEENGTLCGVMGLQNMQEVTLVRHAYVRRGRQRRGIGACLLRHVRQLATTPILIGTWADAVWAIRFYEKNGFQKLRTEQKDRLLKRYWTIPERQARASVILAEATWCEANDGR
jgi:GNAT superfamily N-acetyltransferase